MEDDCGRNKRRTLKELYEFGGRYVNYKLGSLGALVGGGVACATNIDHGLRSGVFSGARQALYVFLVGGYNTKTCEKMAEKFDSRILSLIVSSLVPTAQSGIMMYFYHKFLGTPDPGQTALTISLLNIPAFFLLGRNFRKHYEQGTKGILH